MDFRNNGTMWKVYAARDYDVANPRLTDKVEVNIPEHTPTVPQDANYTSITLHHGYFVNSNYPKVPAVMKSSHAISLPLLKGTTCPVYFAKGTPFLLVVPTSKIEEGYLLYIEE